MYNPPPAAPRNEPDGPRAQPPLARRCSAAFCPVGNVKGKMGGWDDGMMVMTVMAQNAHKSAHLIE